MSKISSCCGEPAGEYEDVGICPLCKEHCDWECEHEWEFRLDWGGNPDVPNGTFDASTYYCPLCDTEQTEEPADYDPPFDIPYEDER